MGTARNSKYALGSPERLYGARLFGSKTEIPAYVAFGLVQAQAQTPSIQSITDNNVQVVLEEEQYEVGPVSCARK